PVWLWAQSQITGTVSDPSGQPIGGASVSVKGSSPQIATSTDERGRYAIQVPAGAVLRYSFVGYLSLEEEIGNRTQIDVQLQVDDATIDEVVVVGYGTQKKVTLTGAVSGVKGTEMRATRNENPQNMLAGRIAGVRVWQQSAEPGAYRSNFDIRGMGAPLVIIDGVPRSIEDFQRLNP